MNNIKKGADLKVLERSGNSPGIPLKFLSWPSCSLGAVSTLSTGSDKTVRHFTRGAAREPLHVDLS